MPKRTQIVLSLILLKLWHNDADSYPVGGGGRWAWQVGVAGGRGLRLQKSIQHPKNPNFVRFGKNIGLFRDDSLSH